MKKKQYYAYFIPKDKGITSCEAVLKKGHLYRIEEYRDHYVTILGVPKEGIGFKANFKILHEIPWIGTMGRLRTYLRENDITL